MEVNMSNISVQDVLRQAEDIDVMRLDYTANTRDLRMLGDGQLDVSKFEIVHGTTVPNPSEPAPVNLTTHGLGQLADKLGIKYGRAFFNNNPSVPTGIRADLFNHFLENTDEKDLLVRTYEEYARGVLSDKYLIMDNAWVLRQALEFLTDRNTGQVLPHAVLPNYHLSADRMAVTILLKTSQPDGGSDGIYGHGVNIRNGTVGNSSTNVARAFLRNSCFNSVYDRQIEWAVRHLGGAQYLAERESTIIAAIGKAFEASADLVNRMIRSRRQRLPNVFDIINKMTDEQGFPDELNTIIAAGTEQDAAAHAVGLEDDTRDELSSFSGHLLTKFGDGETEGEALARSLFAVAGSKKHQMAYVDGS
jgi:hypothetical protein